MAGLKPFRLGGSPNAKRSAGSVFLSVRKPDGSVVTRLDRKTYESALSQAKAALRKNALSGR
jgi:uncharacterized protein YfaS (alpha-2-macroglobulin family)